VTDVPVRSRGGAPEAGGSAPRERSPRSALDRDRIVEAALAVGDAEGLDAVTFRRVAGDLGVSAMSLYRHVASKEDLLEAMADRALAPAVIPEEGDSWTASLEAVLRAYRELLAPHPAAVLVLTLRPTITTHTLRASEALLGILRRAGFPPAQAAGLASEIASRTVQLVRLELAAAAQTSDQRVAASRWIAALIAAQPPDEFPYVREATPHLTAAGAPSSIYETGLELLLAGVGALHERL
jgi:AcrR family transcriptional regulator